MLILRKKRLLLITTCVLISLFIFQFKIANNENIVPTVSLPSSNKVVIIDAGHRISRWRSSCK